MIPLSGLFAGLSVGVYCIGICLPIFVPILLSQQRTTKSSFMVVLEFSAGRLVGYLIFGGLIGFLGETIQSGFLHTLINFATLLMGLVMIGYSFGFLKWGAKVCGRSFGKVKVPFLLGFLTGVNICPPFLASLSYVFNLKSFIWAVLYFLMFFIGTSLYIVPLGFLGFLTRESIFQKIAQVSGILVGGYFLVSSLRVFISR